MWLGYIDPGTGYTLSSIGAWFVALCLGVAGTGFFFMRRLGSFFNRHKRRVVLIAFVAGILTLIASIGVIMKTHTAVAGKKVVLIGFDGMSPEIVEPMMTQGELPHFALLKEKGSYRRLATTNPSQSPVAWTGFATGMNPGKHGIFDFIVRDPKTYGLRLSLAQLDGARPKPVVKGKQFWRYASEKRIPCIIVNCPLTFPPDTVHGRMLSGMGVPDILGTEGTFTFYTTDPLPADKDIGGKVFSIRRSPTMVLQLIGPKVATASGPARNARVPFKVSLEEKGDSVTIAWQGHSTKLPLRQWSGWQEVTFPLGFLRKARGIFKFYLVEKEPGFNLYVSPIEFDPRTPLFPLSFPKGYSKGLTKTLGLYSTRGMPMDTWPVNELRLDEDALLEQAEAILTEKRLMLRHELSRLRKGILFFYFEATDIIQHMFWRATDKRHPLYTDEIGKQYGGTIRQWYRKMDDILAEVMRSLDDDDTLIVLSDHGFNTFRRAAHVNTWLRENGYLFLKDEASKKGRELLADVDWSRTKAYAIGFGSIYLNLRGREKSGIVTAEEAVGLAREIAQKIRSWQDDTNGAGVIHNVWLRDEIFHGPHTRESPDLYLGFNIGYRASWQTALGGCPATPLEDNLKKWSGDHLFDPTLIPGILFTNKPVAKASPSLYDLAPTILEEAGFTDEEIRSFRFDGEAFF